jgi:GNAT superfamily N-acetyltransferase
MPSDVARLVGLMSEFYAESGYPVHPQRAAETFAVLVGDPRLGRVWLLESGGADAGYLVVTLGYSMEYGGTDAFLDDLFVRAPFRGSGLGTAALKAAREFCLDHGVRALHLEVERGNGPAQRLYRAAGFEDNERQLLTLRLAAPLHAV